MDLTVLPLLQQKGEFYDPMAAPMETEDGSSFSFMQLLGALLQSAAADLISEDSEQQHRPPICTVDENQGEEAALQPSAAALGAGAVFQLYPGEEIPQTSAVEVSITQLFCPAEQSGSVSGQAEASAACASPDCQQEMSAGSKTLIADMPQTEAARREKSAVQGKADTLPAGKEQDGISKAECPICEATAPHSGKEQQNIRPVQRQESVLASQSAFEQLAEPPLTNERAPTPKSRVNIDAQSDGEGRAVQAEQEGTKTDLPPAPLDVKGAPTGPIAEDMRINTANNKIAFKSDIAPERTLDNLTDQIVDKADLFLGKDHADLKLKLNPEFLGQLKLNIRVVKGIVQAHFIAENLATAGLIEGRLYDLRHSLEQQGISWQQLSVSVDGQQGQQVSQNFAGAGESYGGYRQMSGSESSVCAAEEQQNERAVQWQPGSVNYLI